MVLSLSNPISKELSMKKCQSLTLAGILVFFALTLTACLTAGGGRGNNGTLDSWTAVRNHPFENKYDGIVAVAYGGGRFVIGGDSRIAWSPDGEVWTLSENADSIFKDSHIQAIAWGDGRFVAMGNPGKIAKIAWSTNGANWTAIADTALADIEFYGIAWGKDRFVAVGSGTIAWSTNGVDWTVVTDPAIKGVDFYRIAWGGGRFVVIGGFGEIAWSTNGETWTMVTDPAIEEFGPDGIAWGDGRFVMTGYGERGIAWSTNGETWTVATDPDPVFEGSHSFSSIAWGGDRFVAVDDYSTGYIIWSTNGESWKEVEDYPEVAYSETHRLFVHEIYGIAYGGGRFVAVGQATIGIPVEEEVVINGIDLGFRMTSLHDPSTLGGIFYAIWP
jgi:hypothetical protein